MGYQDKYRQYLEAVPDIVRQCKETGSRPVLAYTSNLDVIAKWDVDSFNKLLDEYLVDEPSFKEGETINDMNDFARIMTYFAINGYGGEVEITSIDVIEIIKEYFEVQDGLGGTCAQGAAALGAMGIPVLMHLTDQSKEVIKWLDYEGMESVKDSIRTALSNCATDDQALIHLVMQFTKGDIIKGNGKEYKIPVSNRLIMDYDQVHKYMPVREDFLKYLEDNSNLIYSYDISGFNAIIDMKTLEGRLDKLEAHYKILKEKNPDVIIYFESAHFISTKIRDYLYERMSKYMDIMGMNEEELVAFTKTKDIVVDKDNIESIIEGLNYLLDLYPVKGIVMHSKDYALYYGVVPQKVDLEMGLTLGNLMSGTRAKVWHYGSQEECRDFLDVKLSEVGVSYHEKIKNLDLKHTAILVPSRYLEKPKYTIGLGDTFVAGMQMCFVK